VNTDAALSVAAVEVKDWECVQLAPRSKKPIGRHWMVTKDVSQVAAWFQAGFNVGLVCHERTGVAVLDPDELLEWADMVDILGQPCLPWVLTGSDRLHYYVQWEADLPPKLTWHATVIGEIQRGPGQQQVVLPGSVHPNGHRYRWITERLGFLCEPIDPVHDPLPALPWTWRAYLRHATYAAESR